MRESEEERGDEIKVVGREIIQNMREKKEMKERGEEIRECKTIREGEGETLERREAMKVDEGEKRQWEKVGEKSSK